MKQDTSPVRSTEDYPLNLLNAVAQGEWSAPLPSDIVPSLAYVLATLTDKEQDVLVARYKEQKSLAEVAEEMGLSTRERVRQIEGKALHKLRHPSRIKYLVDGVQGVAVRRAFQDALDSIQQTGAHIESVSRLLTLAENRTKVISTVIPLIQGEKEKNQKAQRNRQIPIEDVNSSVRTYHCLHCAGKHTLGDLADMTYDELCRIRNLGQKCIVEIIDILHSHGLELKK